MSAVPTRAREGGPPRVDGARRRGVIRLDHAALTNPRLMELTNFEFRALVQLWSWTAKYGKEGEFPRKWLRGFAFVAGDRRRRITPRMLERFIDLSLVEEHRYDDDGSEVLQISGWREYQPVDSTSAERKRRFRRRLYGDRYYGTLGDVAEIEIVVPRPEEIAAPTSLVTTPARQVGS